MCWNTNQRIMSPDLTMNYFMTNLKIGNISLEIKGEKGEEESVCKIINNLISGLNNNAVSANTSVNDVKEIPKLEIPSSPLIKQFVDEFMKASEKQNISKSSLMNRERSLETMFWILGDDIRVSDMTATNTRNLIKVLYALPAHYPLTMSVQDVLNLGMPARSHRTSTSARMNLNVFFDWLIGEGHIEENPIRKIPAPKAPRSLESLSYINYTHEQLKVIFSQSLVDWSAKFAHRYWVTLIALYSGARAAEIFQLCIEDVCFDSEIPYFDINANNDKRIKNAASIRKIPIHPKLLELGFKEYYETIKADKYTRLFPDAPRVSKTKGSISFCTVFSQFLIKLGVKSEKLVFHSFRHTFISELQNASIPLEIRQSIAGHKAKDITTAVYGVSSSLKQMKEAMEKVDYHLDIPKMPLTRVHARTRLAVSKKEGR